LTNHYHILALIIASIATPLKRAKTREFLLPVSQYMGLNFAKTTSLTYSEIIFTRYRRQLLTAN
jgi:hypothetical protein